MAKWGDVVNAEAEGDAEPNEVTNVEPSPRKPKENRLMRGLEGLNATLATGFDAATFGLSAPFMGSLGALSELGAGGSAGDVGEAFTEGSDATKEFFQERRDKLPFALSFGAEVAGSIGGAPRVLDNIVSAGMRPLAPTMKNRVANYGLGTAMDVPTATMENYFRNDMSFGEAAQQGLLDALVGRTMQGVLGDVGMPAMQKLWRRVRGYSPEGFAVASLAGGEMGKDLNVTDLYNMSKALPKEGTIFEQPIGNAPLMRYHNTLSALAFADPAATKTNTEAFLKSNALKDEMIAHTDNLVKMANDDIANTLDDVLLGEGPMVPRVRTAAQDRAAETFDDLGREYYPKGHPKAGETPLGAQQIDTLEFRGTALKAFEDDFGKKLESMGDEEKAVWNHFKDKLRTQEVETQGGAVKNLPVVDKAGVDVGDKYYVPMSLARLYGARKDMADLLKPMATVEGKPINGSQRKAISALLKQMDKRIDDEVGGKLGIANGVWTAEMKKKEAGRLGRDFYAQRTGRVADPEFEANRGQTLKELKESMTDDEWGEFQKGYKQSMRDLIRERSAHGELSNVFGDISDGVTAKQKLGGIEDVKLVLGEKAYERLRSVYTDKTYREELTTSLRKMLKDKGASPKQIEEAIGPKGELVAHLLKRPEDNGIIGTLAKMKRQLHGKDANKVDAMFKLALASDEELRKLLEKGVRSISPSGGQIGSTVTGIMSGPSKEEDEERRNQALQDETEAYFKRLNGE